MNNKVISLEDIRLKKLQNKENKEILIEKVKSRKTILELNYYDLSVFIDICCKYLESFNRFDAKFYTDTFDTQEDIDTDIKVKQYECEKIIKMIKYLAFKFKNCNFVIDTLIELTLDDIYLLWEAFELEALSYLDLDFESKPLVYKKNYLDKNKFEKTTLYFYKDLRDIAFEYINEINLIKLGEKEFNKKTKLKQEFLSKIQDDEYESTLNYFKKCYIDEYLSSEVFIYENSSLKTNLHSYNFSSDIDTLISSIYFLKYPSRIQDTINKFRYNPNSNIYISYICKDDIEAFIDEFGKDECPYKYGSGYRIEINSLTQDEYLLNQDTIYSDMNYYEARYIYELNILNNSEFAKGLNLKIINRKDVDFLELDKDCLFEHIFNSIENVIYIYQGDWTLAKDKSISNSLLNVLEEYYS